MNNTLTTLRSALSALNLAPMGNRTAQAQLEAAHDLRALIASMEAQEPVSAEIRFCQPQKTAIDSGWGPWYEWKVLAKAPDKIDSRGYLVEYRLLYTHPAQPSEPKSEPAHDDLTIAYLSGFHDGKKAKSEPVQEPVAWMDPLDKMTITHAEREQGDPADVLQYRTPLYATPQALKPLTCAWTEQDADDLPGVYATGCGEMWSFTDGSLLDNTTKFCPYCGGSVEEHGIEGGAT